ncbi:acetolactate synthase large subunit [Pelagicoccus sp. SDUM812003]|uniref:acetolactate synthase large subunit n=1 Tax=Pelagicoccus sp. SDUM812003 TaxID=3041267 RepID=UPI00280FCD5D|nr:acetolactate synthase large subunit [Pelagicoccus sp. SDUM812003]MDQ8202205.1 acetolactate synthase large subunit [Pelagicoccus sp. SDUM812003]
MKASDLFIKALENEGVEYIFGVPGEENLDFLDSLRKSGKIKLVLTRHEQAAGFMAATYGRLTGRPGVCLSTLGPGATNFVTAAAYAQLGAMPMIMISGQKPIMRSKQGRFQIVDVVGLMKPLTKLSSQIVSGRMIPSIVRESFRTAATERPGAVYLELPEDVARDEVLDTNLFERSTRRYATASDEVLRLAAEKIVEANSPLVLIGAGANRKQVRDSVEAFIDRSSMYWFSTQMGLGVVDSRHPRFLGTAALSELDYLHCAIDQADLIVNIGHDVVEKPPFLMEHGGKEVIHVNYFPAQVDEVYFPQLEVVGDIGKSLERLTELVAPNPYWDFSYFERVQDLLKERTSANSDDERFPVVPQRFVADVRSALPEDGIVTLDNGIYKVWFARSYPVCQPNTLLLDNALATMGAGLPSAIAAKLIHPERKVISVCGDGGFMMNSQELETAVRLGIDLVVLVLRDNAYGMIKWKQAGMGFENWGLDYGNPDFVAYAASYGARSVRVESVDELKKCLERGLEEGGVWLVELPVDYSENERVLVKELREKACLV